MTNRLEKRHKRQVARAKQRVKLSEPDVRTPEQIKAAREASQNSAPKFEPANRKGTASVPDSAPEGDV